MKFMESMGTVLIGSFFGDNGDVTMPMGTVLIGFFLVTMGDLTRRTVPVVRFFMLDK